MFEEFLEGPEVSLITLTDGETIVPFEPARDHKPVFDGDEGPNTGGMGVVTPVAIQPRLMTQVETQILFPTVHALNRERRRYQGFLYAGLMLTANGPRVLEYNCRLGDPETQPLMMRMKSDLVPLLLATAEGRLGEVGAPEWDARVAVCVVACSGGYPGDYKQRVPIFGLDRIETGPDLQVFHASSASCTRRHTAQRALQTNSIVAPSETRGPPVPVEGSVSQSVNKHLLPAVRSGVQHVGLSVCPSVPLWVSQSTSQPVSQSVSPVSQSVSQSLYVCLYVYLSACMHVYPSMCLCLYVSVYIYIYIYARICRSLSVCMYGGRHVCLHVCLSVCLSDRRYVCLCMSSGMHLSLYRSLCICRCIRVGLCLSVSMHVCSSVSLSRCPAVSRSQCLSVYASVCMYVSVSVYLSVSVYVSVSVSVSL